MAGERVRPDQVGVSAARRGRGELRRGPRGAAADEVGGRGGVSEPSLAPPSC